MSEANRYMKNFLNTGFSGDFPSPKMCISVVEDARGSCIFMYNPSQNHIYSISRGLLNVQIKSLGFVAKPLSLQICRKGLPNTTKISFLPVTKPLNYFTQVLCFWRFRQRTYWFYNQRRQRDVLLMGLD